MKDLLFLDFETRSEANLKIVGAYKYARDPSTEPILLSYAFGEERVYLEDMSGSDKTLPPRVAEHVQSGGTVVAWNIDFDQDIWNNTEGFPKMDIDQCIDAMGMSSAMGLPRSLSDACTALRIKGEVSKLAKAEATRLINKFSIAKDGEPFAPRGKAWDAFCEYALRDTAALRACYDNLLKLSPTEIDHMRLDMRINANGIPFDTEALDAAGVRAGEVLRENEFTCKAISGFNPTQTKELRNWVNKKLAASSESPNCVPRLMEDFTARAVRAALEEERTPSEVRTILECRQIAGKTSVAKIVAMQDIMVNGRGHGCIAYHVATTGRAGGRKIQPQNMPRPHIKQHEIEQIIENLFAGASMQDISSCLRGLIASDEGLTGADLANIEGRMLAWLAGEEWKLEAFRQYDKGNGEDIYKLAASGIYGVEVSDLPEGARQIGKTAELACGYQGAKGAFQTMATTLGVVVQDSKAESIVKSWRDNHPATVRFWKALESKAALVVRYGKPMRVNSRISFRMEGKHLMMTLPSGRELCYPFARMERKEMPWGGQKSLLTFFGKDSYTNRWGDCHTYGGKLCENATQAAARDVLYESMMSATEAGLKIVMHVHDEIVVEGGGTTVEDVCNHLTKPVPWAPGLPLAAEGWTGRRFRK